MQDYEQYREHADVTSTDMVKALQPHFRGFTKNIMAYLNRPGKYGICLVPEAERIIVETFGSGPGLASRKYKKHRPAKRSKGHAVTVRMDDDLYLRLMSLKTDGEYPTTQALAEALLRDSLERGQK